MKVYLEPHSESRGLLRVRDALLRYMPEGIEIVKEQGECDLAILHVFGRHTSTQKTVQWLKDHGKKYAIIQYCLRSTMRPDTKDWIEMWKGAKLVWSYYDLPALCSRDGMLYGGMREFPFYHAPLGVDAGIFYPRHIDAHYDSGEVERFVITTCSQHALTEGVKECVVAAKRVGRKVFHLGHDLRRGDDVVCISGISDQDLSWYYSHSDFVSGLRRVEGFELPAAEGLLCGARPILYDQPHYRHWYDGLATFIPEVSREEVTDILKRQFIQGPAPVSRDEIEEAKKRFDWPTIITGFWGRVL